jgi:purine-nucleoside phosphorylase
MLSIYVTTEEGDGLSKAAKLEQNRSGGMRARFSTMTPHNEAEREDYTGTILLPGDPQRAEWIAERFLSDVRTVNRWRGEPGFTGTFRDIPVSVQSTGMGAPSLGIYVHELLDAYRARTLIRVGTCGGLTEGLKLRSLVLSQAASGDSSLNDQLFAPFHYAPCADFSLLRLAADRAAALGIPHVVGRTASSDIFYHPDRLKRFARLRQYGVIAVDMETSALYTLAARFSARALSICTVVDNMITADECSHSERQELFRPMTELALDVIVADAGSQSSR